jgi:glycosyltransferase involved in cell wall biosynthesis
MRSPYREKLVPHSSASYEHGSEELSPPAVSVVVPAFCEEGNLWKLYEELSQVHASLAVTWELIVVDDGSIDDTWTEIIALHQRDARVKGVRLSRNFGHQYALFAGISRATGRVVITMDADLQHPPAAIPELLAHWQEGSKVVHTVRIDHPNTSWGKRITSRIFYKIFTLLSGVELSAGMADFRLLDRQVVDELIHLHEGHLFLRGLIHWVGYPSSSVEFRCRDRFSGVSKYDLWKMLKFAWMGVTCFSLVPLRLATILGLATSVLAFGWLAFAVWARLFTDRTVPGWTSVVAIESLLFGILFIILGIIGEYIGRVLEEVRWRPRFIVDELVGFIPPDTNLAAVQHPLSAQHQ